MSQAYTDKYQERIQILEAELSKREKELESFKEILSTSQEILRDAMDDKKTIQKRLDKLEHMKVEFNVRRHQKLQNDHDKLQHRYHVTKKLLEEARLVIIDLEKRGLLDYILKRYPDSFLEFNKDDPKIK
jgi:chromosome segregation ATPase